MILGTDFLSKTGIKLIMIQAKCIANTLSNHVRPIQGVLSEDFDLVEDVLLSHPIGRCGAPWWWLRALCNWNSGCKIQMDRCQEHFNAQHHLTHVREMACLKSSWNMKHEKMFDGTSLVYPQQNSHWHQPWCQASAHMTLFCVLKSFDHLQAWIGLFSMHRHPHS